MPVPFSRRSSFCGTCLLLSLAVISIIRSPNWSPICSYYCYKCDDQEQYGSTKMYSRRYGYSLLLWTSMLILDVFFSSELVLSYGLLCNFVFDRNLCSLNIPVLCLCLLWHIVETPTCPLHHHYMSMNCVQSNCSTTASCIFTCVAELCPGGIWRRTHLSNLGLHSSVVHEGADILL